MTRTALGIATLALVVACGIAPVTMDPGSYLPASARDRAEQQIVVTIADDGVAAHAPAGGSPRPAIGPGAYSASPFGHRVAAELARDYGLERVAAWYIRVLSVHCVVLQAADDSARDTALARLRSDPRVESAEPMRRFVTSARTLAYNDPYFDLQSSARVLDIAGAHRWTRGRGVTVAIIDTGMDLRHPDIAGRLSGVRNLVDDDMAQFVRDRHGTAVAGVLAAAANNGVGIVGVAPEVRILALKACWERSGAESAACNTLTLAAALVTAIEARVRVINLSLSGPADPLLGRLIRHAIASQIVVVAPYDERVPRSQSFPASFDGVLGVVDADDADGLAGMPPLAAPGRDVLTLKPAGHYGYSSGASLSTAMVSGIAALLLERRPDLNAATVAALIGRTARSDAERVPLVRIVNACGAIAAIVEDARCAVQEAPADGLALRHRAPAIDVPGPT